MHTLGLRNPPTPSGGQRRVRLRETHPFPSTLGPKNYLPGGGGQKKEKGQEGAEKTAKSDEGFAPGHFWPAARAPGITLSPALRNRTPQIGPKSSFLRNWRPPNRSQTLVSDVCHAPNRSQIVLPAQLDPHIGPKSAILRKWTPRNSPQWIKNPC